MNDKKLLHTEDLSIGFRHRRKETVVAEHLDLTLNNGDLICLLGPNGSGKSTLIRTLAKMQAPLEGRMLLSGRDMAELSAKETAHRVSTVLTDRITVGNLTAYNLVAFGRSPYTGLLGRLTGEDREVVKWAIEATGLEDLVDRDILKLSDGERQKVMIARALAQDTELILLDEPTAHLDLPNRVEIIQLLGKLAHETNKAILMSTHELDMALKAADRVWLLNSHKGMETGVPEDLVLDGTFEEVFRRDSFDFDRETGSFRIHRERDKQVGLTGDPVPRFWTRRALKREGYRVVDRREEFTDIRVTMHQNRPVWLLQGGDVELYSVEELICYLRRMERVREEGS